MPYVDTGCTASIFKGSEQKQIHVTVYINVLTSAQKPTQSNQCKDIEAREVLGYIKKTNDVGGFQPGIQEHGNCHSVLTTSKKLNTVKIYSMLRFIRKQVAGQTAAPQIGETYRQIQRIPIYWSRNPDCNWQVARGSV